jgi:archaemetzincin
VDGLALVAIGPLPGEVLPHLAGSLAAATGARCVPAGTVIDPSPAYDVRRGQYDCRRLFPALEALAARSGGRVLGVADVDLFSAVFTFVFGEAKLGGSAAMISLHRLRPEEYGLPADEQLLRLRAEREALHEVGHLLGLVHCRRPECVMRFSGSVEEVDLKESLFCSACRSRLDEGLRIAAKRDDARLAAGDGKE